MMLLKHLSTISQCLYQRRLSFMWTTSTLPA